MKNTELHRPTFYPLVLNESEKISLNKILIIWQHLHYNLSSVIVFFGLIWVIIEINEIFATCFLIVTSAVMKNMSKCNLNQLACISKVPLSQAKFLTAKNEKKSWANKSNTYKYGAIKIFLPILSHIQISYAS